MWYGAGMVSFEVRNRILHIEGNGTLLVTSDLHGNLPDFARMVELLEAEPGGALLSLGDLFHGPNISPEDWAANYYHLGDYYEDRSDELLRQALALEARFPGRVAALLGNHEHAHVGGPVVAKFHADEAAAFEARLGPDERVALRDFINAMPLMAVATNGVAFTHGAPPARHSTRRCSLTCP